MLRWSALISWTICALVVLNKIGNRHGSEIHAVEVSRRVERSISLPGFEWTTTIKENPIPVTVCAPAGGSAEDRVRVVEAWR